MGTEKNCITCCVGQYKRSLCDDLFCEKYHSDGTAEDFIKMVKTGHKTGRWIKTARWGRVYYCNQCRNYLDFDGVNAGRGCANFCPNCGVKMEGGDDNDRKTDS